MFELPHQPGALADAMAIFKRNRLNLTWIESFPMPETPNEYLFFVEFQGHPEDCRPSGRWPRWPARRCGWRSSARIRRRSRSPSARSGPCDRRGGARLSCRIVCASRGTDAGTGSWIAGPRAAALDALYGRLLQLPDSTVSWLAAAVPTVSPLRFLVPPRDHHSEIRRDRTIRSNTCWTAWSRWGSRPT